MSRQTNYYRILNVGLTADQAQIQHAYRALAKRYHPDLVPRDRREWARGQMARINAAYEILGDPTRRATYDRQQGYIGATQTGPASPRPKTPQKKQETHRVQWRGERWRRERMSRQRLLVLSSAVVLGALLLGALYWWRMLAAGLPRHRWTWTVLLSVGLGAVLVILGRATR